jgi:hypothetical protein
MKKRMGKFATRDSNISSTMLLSGISFSGLTMPEKRKHPLYKRLKRLFGRKIKWAMDVLEKNDIDKAEVF